MSAFASYNFILQEITPKPRHTTNLKCWMYLYCQTSKATCCCYTPA